MAEINKINIGGVEYDIAGSGSGTTIVTKTLGSDDNDNPIITEAFTEEEFNALLNDEYSILRLVTSDDANERSLIVTLPKMETVSLNGMTIILFENIAATPESTLAVATGINVAVMKGPDSSISYEVAQMDIPKTSITANPTLSGSETALTSVAINGTNYKIPSGGSGSGSAGSLIIEKEFNEDGESITLTEDEYLQLVGDPNGVIKIPDGSAGIFFKQLVPIVIGDSTTESITPSLKFYCEMLITNGDITTRAYGVLSEGDNPLTYVVHTQFNLFDGGSPYAYDIGTVSIGYESYGVLDGKTGTLSEENYNKLYWTANPLPSILQENKIYLYTAAITNPDGYDIARFSLVRTGGINTWACTLPDGLYILKINSDKTWSITKQKIAFDDSWATLDCSWTPSADSTFLTTTGSMGRSSDGTANVVTLTVNSGVQDYHGYPQLLVRNFSPLTSATTPAAVAPTFMIAETGQGTDTGKKLELFYTPTWATESTSLFTATTTANLFNTTQLTSATWYSLGVITIPQGQWSGKKSLSGLTIQANLTDNFELTSATGSNLSINNVISFNLPAVGNKCIWQGVTPEFEMYQGMAAIDNVSISSLPSGKVYRQINMGSSYSWTATSSAVAVKNPVCFKLMHAFGPEAGLANSTNNSKYYNYQYEATGSARLQNDWVRVTCNVDEDTIDLANVKVMSATNISIQLQR